MALKVEILTDCIAGHWFFQAPLFDFDENDVYMSSHEHRFRLFSSVEYEGQLYMTAQNFIESVTMSEPRMSHILFSDVNICFIQTLKLYFKQQQTARL